MNRSLVDALEKLKNGQGIFLDAKDFTAEELKAFDKKVNSIMINGIRTIRKGK